MESKQIVVFIKEDESINVETEKQINRDSVYLIGMWNKYSLDEICPLIKEWNASSLWLNWNFNKQILKTIQNIKFSQLKYILLVQNRIESVEGINRIYMPELEELNLIKNKINFLRQFRKINLLSLNKIAIYRNALCEGEALTRMKNASKISEIWFDFCTDTLQTIHYLNWICKLQSRQFKILYIINKKSIIQNNLKEMIKSKYQNIEIKEYEKE